MKDDPLDLDLVMLAPVGHFLALRIGFAYPMEEVNALPPGWIELYTSRGLFISDPIMHWVHRSLGVQRWSALGLEDPQGVLGLARAHGMAFGAAVSMLDAHPGGQRSYGAFARADREFSDGELDLLAHYVRARHEALIPPANITAAELEALRLIKEGQRLKQIAFELGVSEGAVKQRLKSARLKLKAKTGAEAISRASLFGLI